MLSFPFLATDENVTSTMENDQRSLKPQLEKLEKLNSERRESEITMSLSDYELQKIKEELEVGLRGFEGSEENLSPPSVFVNPHVSTPFDIPLTEEECALLERCTIGSPSKFCETPRASICSASLDLLADSLIRDLEELDSVTRNAASDEHEYVPATGNLTSGKTEEVRSDPDEISLSFGSANSAEATERSSVSEGLPRKQDAEKLDFNHNNGSLSTMDSSETSQDGTASPIQHIASEKTDESASNSARDSENVSRSTSLDSDSLPASIDSGLPVRDVVVPQHRFFVVVAIDFGTTFSGYAFSFTRDGDSIHMMRRWEGGDPGVSNQKTPTTLLLKPDGSFHSFGFGARDFYHDLEHDEAKKWMYFEKFKMTLHTNKVSFKLWLLNREVNRDGNRVGSLHF